MRSLAALKSEYEQSHRNRVNQAIHMVCVPVIFLSTLGLLWTVALGPVLHVQGSYAAWVNLATLSSLPILVFYWSFSARVGLLMSAWFAATFAACSVMQAHELPLAWICSGLWIAAWAGQFFGHAVEGAKPSFFSGWIFHLVAPLFVMDKLSGLRR